MPTRKVLGRDPEGRTGTVSARVFVLSFVSDGTNLYEAGRTAAIVA